MIVLLALRSLATRPIRTLVLACGFGLGIAVMAVLLGVGEVILEQARSPELRGGGDVVVSGGFGALDNARFVLSSVLGADDVARRIAVRSPSRRAALYLVAGADVTPLIARGGVPSLEKAMGDREVAGLAEWTDAPSDARWVTPDAADLLRAMDRFHPQPDVPAFATSWAEWLYFNGRTADGRTRLYLTFLVGPSPQPGKRAASVRLQLDHEGRQTNYSAAAEVDEQTVLASAPDLEIGDNHVSLVGLQYRIRVRLAAEGGRRSRLTGELTLDARAGRSVPPAAVHGARGWMSGYVVPVSSGTLGGALQVDGATIALEKATGYHDHNWGFWQDVRWQWGQVAHDDLSIVYGRVFPPPEVADPDRIPGFLEVLGPDGPMAFSTDVSIMEQGGDEAPRQVMVSARGDHVDVQLSLLVDRSVRTQLGMTATPTGREMDFLQLGGQYRVTGRVAERSIDFTARGAAETFRPR